MANVAHTENRCRFVAKIGFQIISKVVILIHENDNLRYFLI